MLEWAKQECILACKKENPDYDFNSNEFDYGCSCYKSALKAYESLCNDGHSGMSWGFTVRILEKLLHEIPLSPITDDDFFLSDISGSTSPAAFTYTAPYLRERGIKVQLVCPRLHGLFRCEKLDGTVFYQDVNRAYFVDIENPSNTYHSNMDFLDEMFPITMPYLPSREKYKIYAQTFLADEKNGDFDTKGILYLITPSGEKVDLNIYKTEKNGKMVDISETEYKELLEKRIDKVSVKISNRLIGDLEEKIGKKLYSSQRAEIFNNLNKLCEFFDTLENCKYNTSSVRRMILNSEDLGEYKSIPELVKISEYIKNLKQKLG